MPWGAKRGVDDLVERLARDDPTLTSLHVFRARTFGLEEVQKLCMALRGNTTLKELYTSGHVMEPQAAAAVSKMLCVNTTLHTLCVGDDQFGDQGLEALAEGIQGSASLTHLDLENKGITAIGVQGVHAALAASTCLRELNVARNALGDGGVATLAAALPTMLTTLDMRETGMGEAGAHALMDALSGNATLTTLHAARNPLGAGGAVTLATGLRRCGGVTALDLSGVALGVAGAAAVGAAVAAMPQLTALTLNECAIDAEGGRLFAQAAFGTHGDDAAPRQLQKLHMQGNALDEGAVEAFAHALYDCGGRTAALDLDVGGNKVDAAGVTWLARTPLVGALRLFNTGLGDAGVRCLVQHLTQGNLGQLAYLDLCGVGMGAVAAAELSAALAAGGAPALQVLEVGANPATQHDTWEEAVKQLRVARPALDVVWRTSDPGEGRDQVPANSPAIQAKE